MQEVQWGEHVEEGTEGTPDLGCPLNLIGIHSAKNTHGELLNSLMGAIGWWQELNFSNSDHRLKETTNGLFCDTW